MIEQNTSEAENAQDNKSLEGQVDPLVIIFLNALLSVMIAK